MARTVRDLIRQLEEYSPDLEVMCEPRETLTYPYPFLFSSDGKVYL